VNIILNHDKKGEEAKYDTKKTNQNCSRSRSCTTKTIKYVRNGYVVRLVHAYVCVCVYVCMCARACVLRVCAKITEVIAKIKEENTSTLKTLYSFYTSNFPKN
jgi:hypothetical protein